MANEEKKIQLSFAAINKVIVDSIPQPVENDGRKNYISWGSDDMYPNFLYDLYLNCATLQSIIDGTVNYIGGDGVVSNISLKKANLKGETFEYVISKLASDYMIFGIAYMQVVRNKIGGIAEIYWLDARFVRSDKENELFYYNEDYGKKWGRAYKTVVYPKFVSDATGVATSVVCIKTPVSRGTYGTPAYGSAIKSVVTEVEIDKFHLNELDNNFMPSAVISFNSGIPSDEEKAEIEKNIQEKFSGAENAGRFILSFNNGKDNATTIERLSSDDFDKRYESLSKKTQQRIFTAFGASPVLFGCYQEGTGFNDQDYPEAFKLYNRTRVRPIQKLFIDAFDKVFGVEGSLTIKPFSINWEDDAKEEVVN